MAYPPPLLQHIGYQLNPVGAKRRSSIMQHPMEDSTIDFSKAMRPRRKRVSTILAERLAEEEPTEEEAQGKAESKALKREPRRRTIYIPDDTTVMTIHPGGSLFETRGHDRKPISPKTGLDLVTLSEDEEPVSAIRKEKKSTSRKSLAVAPKRAPLQRSTRPPLNVSFADDVVGAGGGKENLPPGKGTAYQVKAKRKSTVPNAFSGNNSNGRMFVAATIPEDRPMTLWEEHNASQQHQKIGKRLGSESLLNTENRSPKSRKSSVTAHLEPERPVFLTKGSFRPSIAPKDHLGSRQKDLYDPNIARNAKERISRFSVLTEDVANPEMYEEQWLEYQEIALTQLLNCVFDNSTKPMDRTNERPSIRKQMLTIYSDSAFPLLHKRLQASLIYGTMSIPKGHIDNALKLKDDIGLRQRFAKLWIDTYDLAALRAALEVISGREMPTKLSLSQQATSPGNSNNEYRPERRAVARFIDRLFIQHEDASRAPATTGTIAAITRGDHQDDFGTYHWCWRRTVLRGLMLILLLDKTKAAGVIEDCLFLKTSPHKTSTAVLQSFGKLLLPSLGDIIRPLNHINYVVEVEQHPVQELQYHVSNLAVDLRDGMILARLVEATVFGRPLQHAQGKDNEVLPLTQHLKYPCPGRAIKVYNVDITLSALRRTASTTSWLTINTTADDIVDGHREKTLTLLWNIVSEFGFPAVIDWDELRRDIVHRSTGQICEERQRILMGSDSSKVLLMWAQTIAAAKGIDVTNFTTSFADNSAIGAIVEAYLPFFPSPADAATPTKSLGISSLSSKISQLGCSKAFAGLFTNHVPRIPTANETLSTLTFLAARLLPLARVHRATTLIQRQYRQHLSRRHAHQRFTAMKLAHACALVVQTRNRVISATVVLQRAWRKVLDKRLEDFMRDAITIQAISRGWILRRKVYRRMERRKRGGW